jgi:hypothetical protein
VPKSTKRGSIDITKIIDDIMSDDNVIITEVLQEISLYNTVIDFDRERNIEILQRKSKAQIHRVPRMNFFGGNRGTRKKHNRRKKIDTRKRQQKHKRHSRKSHSHKHAAIRTSKARPAPRRFR